MWDDWTWAWLIDICGSEHDYTTARVWIWRRRSVAIRLYSRGATCKTTQLSIIQLIKTAKRRRMSRWADGIMRSLISNDLICIYSIVNVVVCARLQWNPVHRVTKTTHWKTTNSDNRLCVQTLLMRTEWRSLAGALNGVTYYFVLMICRIIVPLPCIVTTC